MRETDSGTEQTKWTRSQRFQLLPVGRVAAANYRDVIVAARSETGRKSFDAARAEWAARLKLEATDGLYLGELQSGPRTVAEMATSLEGCGPVASEVRTAVERLVRLRMVEPLLPPLAPPTPPPRW